MVDRNQIIAKNLCKTYYLKERTGFLKPRTVKSVEAARNVSLIIPHGKIVGLLGVNGAGKTTTIRMLSAIIEPTSGELWIDGVDAIKNHRAVKSRINMITGGERNLYWRLTAKENLDYFGRLYGLSGNLLKDRISQLLKMTDLTDAANTPVERYSKGMKQRLQIARGLVNDPDYLFLDEPTLGLDIIIAKEMRQYISDLAKNRDKGLVLATHYISEADELCDYIYVIDKGSIIAQGSKDELKSLFIFSQELTIMTDTISEDCERGVQSLLSGQANLSINAEDDTKSVKIIGDSKCWPAVIKTMTDSGSAIINISSKEPDLEEILLNIITDFRKSPEE